MAFDLAKPSISDADWPTFAANIRENIRAIVEGDAGVFAKAGDMTLQVTTTGSATFARVAVRSGNGTSSARNSYFRAETLETTPQAWHVGMLGTKSFGIRDETAAVTRVIIDQATGNVGVGGSPSFRLHAISTTAPQIVAEYDATHRAAIWHLSGEGYVGTQTNTDFIVRTNDTNRIVIKADGHVDLTLPADNAVLRLPNGGIIQAANSGGTYESALWLRHTDNTTYLNFASAGFKLRNNSAADVMQFDANKNVVIGSAALATNATNGFFYLETCAGTPTGTPTAFTGRVAMIYDSTNNKLYAYNGAWKQVTLA